MQSDPMEFHPLSLSDRERVQRITRGGPHRNCDLNFMNQMGWRSLFGTELAALPGRLVFRFKIRDRLAYQLVVADGKWGEALEQVAADARRMGQPLLLMGVCRHAMIQIERAFPGRFRFLLSRDYCDYLYRRDALATLSGKKLQAKRNHANKFARLYPGYVFAPLRREDVPDCLELAGRWVAGREGDGSVIDYQGEQRAIRFVLGHWEELGGLGGTVRVGGRLVAFTYGAAVNADTFDVCVEKADTSYEGAYAVINRDFARSLPASYIYVNREEDIGIAGLRKAKLSYHPLVLLEKFSVTE